MRRELESIHFGGCVTSLPHISIPIYIDMRGIHTHSVVSDENVITVSLAAPRLNENVVGKQKQLSVNSYT